MRPVDVGACPEKPLRFLGFARNRSEVTVRASHGAPARVIAYVPLDARRTYPEGATLSEVPSSVHPTSGVDYGGKQLEGDMILEVPVQSGPVPKPIIDYAAQKNIIIRDINGKVYK